MSNICEVSISKKSLKYLLRVYFNFKISFNDLMTDSSVILLLLANIRCKTVFSLGEILREFGL